MLLRKESLEKSDVCRDFLAYVTAGPRTCLNHLYRSFSKSVYDAGKFQPFLILATLTPPPLTPYSPPSPPPLTPYSQPSHPPPLTPYSPPLHPPTPHSILATLTPPPTPHSLLVALTPPTPHSLLATLTPPTPHSLLAALHPSPLTPYSPPLHPPPPPLTPYSPPSPPPPTHTHTHTPHSLLAALTPHSLLTALQERKWNGRLFFYCRTATVPWFCTSIVLVINRSSHFLCLLPRETPCSSEANNHTVPYPPKAVLWAIGTVSAENVFNVEMNKVVKFIVFHRVNNHLFRCTNRTEYETALTRRFKTHHVPPYELVQAD